MNRPVTGRSTFPRSLVHAIGFAFLFCLAAVATAGAAPGRIAGKIVATDTGEPLGFADLLLIPADTTMKKIGGLTNADGTFMLQAPAGPYTLQVRALSYQTRKVEGIVLEDGELLPFDTALKPEAIQQEEIVVEAKAIQNNEAALLAARKKSASLGDAVSAEVVRKSADKDAGEVLRRVTGLSVSDGKYVFVRGLGERYSSTEIDGVRVASPEQNKRVVPMDLIPAQLLENIVVQKTYTADRPGEFGGGDVQVRTKDFPGKRQWSFGISQGWEEGATMENLRTYPASRADIFGFGSDSRGIPGGVPDRKLVQSNDPSRGYTLDQLAGFGKSFDNVWSPTSREALPSGGWAATYGDEFPIFGRPLGLVLSGNLSRSVDYIKESQRFYQSSYDTLYAYDVQRSQEEVQLGSIAGVSYRLSPRNTISVRGFYTNSAEDEVRKYTGDDHNQTDAVGRWAYHDNTRLMYIQRTVLSGNVGGQHQIPQLFGSTVDWKLARSKARRQQPDRREYTYDRSGYDDGTGNIVNYSYIGGVATREFGDLNDNGWGGNVSMAIPYRLFSLGNGKLTAGYDRQIKERENFYRRFSFIRNSGDDPTAAPESIYAEGNFTGDFGSAYVQEGTLADDNYTANQTVTAGFVSADIPFGSRLRGTFGVRVEKGYQDVQCFDLFDPTRLLGHGRLDNTDVLPSANITWSMTEKTNLRLGASKTLSRPDLNELSSAPALEYVGGYQVGGNPGLQRATINNYDVRVESFLGLSEVLAAGVFYKDLHQPIEQVIQGTSPPTLIPRNSDKGHNVGAEFEARAGLERVWRRMRRLFVNANGSIISSEVTIVPNTAGSKTGSELHPLQGQARYLANLALTWSASPKTEFAVMYGRVGKRLKTLGYDPLPDVYEQGFDYLDATMNWMPYHGLRLKVAAKNLTDPLIQQTQGEHEVSGTRRGRAFSLSLSYGS